jgi:hypothetical protein
MMGMKKIDVAAIKAARLANVGTVPKCPRLRAHRTRLQAGSRTSSPHDAPVHVCGINELAQVAEASREAAGDW